MKNKILAFTGLIVLTAGFILRMFSQERILSYSIPKPDHPQYLFFHLTGLLSHPFEGVRNILILIFILVLLILLLIAFFETNWKNQRYIP